MYDNGVPCGPQANAAKYSGADAGYKACLQAVLTHGGMGYAQEYHVERLLRESLIAKIAPVTEQLILSNIAERVLKLPKSVPDYWLDCSLHQRATSACVANQTSPFALAWRIRRSTTVSRERWPET